MFVSLLSLFANLGATSKCLMYVWEEPECPKSLIK